MQDILTRATTLKRPKLLVTAARSIGADYSRSRLLRRLIGADDTARPARALLTLLDLEAVEDARRRAGDASYTPARHVEILVAVIGEARMLQGLRQIT